MISADVQDRGAEEEERAGQRIGPYEIIRTIGHGGMGTVFLAVRADDQYRKQVAIKLVNRGMDTDTILRRFTTERQILANLEHPNIARLLEGGSTPDGLPYFVMEYIEGQPITEYCDAERLTTIQRLELFRQVCGALQYAHQNLVVHLDIKPRNVLVTDEGVPKLLDFGIVKLLSGEVAGLGFGGREEPRLWPARRGAPGLPAPGRRGRLRKPAVTAWRPRPSAHLPGAALQPTELRLAALWRSGRHRPVFNGINAVTERVSNSVFNRQGPGRMLRTGGSY